LQDEEQEFKCSLYTSPESIWHRSTWRSIKSKLLIQKRNTRLNLKQTESNAVATDPDMMSNIPEGLSLLLLFFLYTSHFIRPYKQKYNGVKSGDLGGQLMVLPRRIHPLGKVSM
jgi:hypothetical protein